MFSRLLSSEYGSLELFKLSLGLLFNDRWRNSLNFLLEL